MLFRIYRRLLFAMVTSDPPCPSAAPEEAAIGRLEVRLLLFGATLSLLICAGLLIYGSGRGLDLTDEIFYIIWARDPNAYALIYQPFGYLLHPLFNLTGGSLQLFRLSGFAITAAAGAWLGYSLAPTGRRLLFSVQGAASALTIFFPWIITPSYNSAANVGAMLVITGLLQAQARRWLPAAIAGAVGVCLAAFAKPPLCAIAVVAMLVTAAVSRRGPTTRGLIAALVLAVALISTLLSPIDAPGLVSRMSAAQHILALPNTPLGLPVKILRDALAVPLVLIGAFIAAALSFALRRTRWFTWPGYAAVALSLCYIVSVAGDAVDGEIPDFIGLSLVLAAAGYAGVLQGRWPPNPLAIGWLLGAPAAVALGTFNNQWSQLNFSMCFPFLALFLLASTDPVAFRRAAFHVLSCAGPAIVMLVAAFDPYSLPASIFDQQIPVEHPITHSKVLVDSETADFVRYANGHAKDAILIDLSGTGPGVAAVLGAKAPVLPWLNPATPTWPDVVWSRLSKTDRENAWFVGPVLPLFARTAPARWFESRKSEYCPDALPEMPFWGQEQVLVVWRPCPKGKSLSR